MFRVVLLMIPLLRKLLNSVPNWGVVLERDPPVYHKSGSQVLLILNLPTLLHNVHVLLTVFAVDCKWETLESLRGSLGI